MLIRPMAGVAGAAALAAALLPAPALAAAEVRIAAGRPGTPWHAFAVALAQRYEAAVPGGKAVTIARGNGYWNPIVVNARRAEFGLSNAASAAWAYRGDETAYRKKKYTDIRAVMAGLQPVWIAAMLRVDYARNTGHGTLHRALRAGPRRPQDRHGALFQPGADRRRQDPRVDGFQPPDRARARRRRPPGRRRADSLDDPGRARRPLFRGRGIGARGGARGGARRPCPLRRSAAGRPRGADADGGGRVFDRSPSRRAAGGRSRRSISGPCLSCTGMSGTASSARC